ncbi:MAG: histidine--tRNA ligase [Alphaproteobacteria bacterium]|nr:histidine--tRNA ligase [Alphaproteobacteria bacterium]
MEKNKIYKPKSISGFPELLPEERIIEREWINKIESVFESYGFANIDTPVVEELDVILAKGETDKEIYTLNRLQADENDKSDARLGLRFDLTVPFARYTAQHFNELNFPFKRYQVQKVWRGERPQEGRYREFTQCDIDVINVDSIPISFDAEMPAIMYKVFESLNLADKIEIQISNRKILQGYLEGLGIEDITTATRIVDKGDKLPVEDIIEMLGEINVDKDTAKKAIKITKIRTEDSSFVEEIKSLGVTSELLEEGLEELKFVMDYLSFLPKGTIYADLAVIRGFDYYTGTVYEMRFKDGKLAIGGGGRYNNLSGNYINKKLPGVGLSLGLSRVLLGMLKDMDKGRKCPTDILVAYPKTDSVKYQDVVAVANTLRERGFNVEAYHTAQNMKKQIAYAEKKGIEHIWFPPFDADSVHEVKNLKTREQESNVDPKTWEIK